MLHLPIMKINLLIIFILFPLFILAGGPWILSKKSGFFQLQSTFPTGSYSNLFLEDNKNLSLTRTALDYTLQAYLEYGLSDKLNIISVLPYKLISTGNSITNNLTSPVLQKGKLTGFSNFKLGFKHVVSDNKVKVAISIMSSFNTVNKNLDKGLITGYNGNSIGFYAHIGTSFSNNFYSFIDGGINTVSNDFSDFIELHYELGYQFKKPLWTAITLDVRESLNNGSYFNDNLRQTGFYMNNQEYFAYGIKISYELKNKVGLTAATFGAFSGNYVAKISTFSIGIYKKW